MAVLTSGVSRSNKSSFFVIALISYSNFNNVGIPEKEVENVKYLKNLLDNEIKKLEKLRKEGLE
jgi:hypothetical protein